MSLLSPFLDSDGYCRIAFFCFFKQKTAYDVRISDWSSDVCSSDLDTHALQQFAHVIGAAAGRRLVRHRADPVDESGTEQAADEIGRASRRERVCKYV